MAFSLDLARTTISDMGYEGMHESDDAVPQVDDSVPPARDSSVEPLFEFNKDEMVRLCRLHEEEVGIMYPVLDMETVISHAREIAAFMDSTRNQRPLSALNDDNTLRLKMVLCCALVVENHGHSDTAVKLFKSMEAVVNQKLMSDPSDVASLPLLALCAGYRFLSNDEVLAWRVMGQVTRLCLELGMHQKRGLMNIKGDADRKNALMSFWSAYILDRRWAFGTGLPYSIQDDEIDPQLPFPVSASKTLC